MQALPRRCALMPSCTGKVLRAATYCVYQRCLAACQLTLVEVAVSPWGKRVIIVIEAYLISPSQATCSVNSVYNVIW